MKIKIFLAGFILPLLFVSVFGQTTSNLEKKYGAPKSYYKGSPLAYEIRPGFFMTVQYSENGQVCDMLIEPFPNYEPNSIENVAIPEDLLLTLINELAPESMRGKEHIASGFTWWFGHVGTKVYFYENVTVSIGNSWGFENGKRKEKMQGPIELQWTNRQCKQK